MGTCYWFIAGVGICTRHIINRIDKLKLLKVLLTQLPDDEELIEIQRMRNLSHLDINDFLCGEPFDNLAELLACCDDTDTLTYADTGENGWDYFYYPPSMPWRRKENEPKTVEEVHKRIINAVMKITDMSAKEIEELIDDDLYEVGWG